MPYIVCRNAHPFRAARVHETLDAAETEAERLCRKEMDIFLVFQLIGEVTLADVPLTWPIQETPAHSSLEFTWAYRGHRAQDIAGIEADQAGRLSHTCGRERTNVFTPDS